MLKRYEGIVLVSEKTHSFAAVLVRSSPYYNLASPGKHPAT